MEKTQAEKGRRGKRQKEVRRERKSEIQRERETERETAAVYRTSAARRGKSKKCHHRHTQEGWVSGKTLHATYWVH